MQLYCSRTYETDQEIKEKATALLQLYPDEVLAHVALGEINLKEGDIDSAEEHFRVCAEVMPSEAAGRMLKVIEARRTGKGAISLLCWTLKRKFMKLFFPGYVHRERTKINWDR